VITTLGDAKVVGHQVETSQLCVGEKLMSLRQLIKLMPNIYDKAFSQVNGFLAGGQGVPAYFNPFLIGATTGTGAGTAVLVRDFLNYFAPYFRFNRGSMRVKGRVTLYQTSGTVANVGQEGMVCTAARPAKPGNVGMFGTDTSGLNPPYADCQPLSDGGMIRVLLPPWQTSVMVPNQYALTTTAPATGLPYRSNALWIAVGGAINASYDELTSAIQLNRQPADDYELLMFIGPPMLSAST